MFQTAVGCDGFERVPDGVAEIEDAAQAGFALIGRDDLGLDLATARDDAGEQRRIEPGDPFQILLDQGEQVRVADHAVFDRLVKPRAQLPRGQAAQNARINDDRARLMESPDQVLAERVIDRRLASDRTVDLREQSRGNLDAIDSAQKSRGDKAREVAYHAAAERDHPVGSFKTIGDQKTPGAFGRAQRFRPLAVAYQMRERREAGALQTLFDGLAIESMYLRVRDDRQAESLTAE